VHASQHCVFILNEYRFDFRNTVRRGVPRVYRTRFFCCSHTTAYAFIHLFALFVLLIDIDRVLYSNHCRVFTKINTRTLSLTILIILIGVRTNIVMCLPFPFHHCERSFFMFIRNLFSSNKPVEHHFFFQTDNSNISFPRMLRS